MSPTPLPRSLSRRKLALALVVAAAADAASIFLTLAPPLGWGLDFLTAALLFGILGWRWVLLPGLVMEAIPGLAAFPFWILVVLAVAVGGRSGPPAVPKE